MENEVKRKRSQNIDDDLNEIMEYCSMIPDSYEEEMFENGVSWHDFF